MLFILNPVESATMRAIGEGEENATSVSALRLHPSAVAEQQRYVMEILLFTLDRPHKVAFCTIS